MAKTESKQSGEQSALQNTFNDEKAQTLLASFQRKHTPTSSNNSFRYPNLVRKVTSLFQFGPYVCFNVLLKVVLYVFKYQLPYFHEQRKFTIMDNLHCTTNVLQYISET